MTGTDADVCRRFDEEGFAVIKSPSSGSATKRDQPDFVVGDSRTGLLIAGEAKSTRKDARTIPEGEAEQLRRFAERFGAEPVIAFYWIGPPGGNTHYGGWWFKPLFEVRRSSAENANGGHHLRPRREDRHDWASIEDLKEGRLLPKDDD